MMGRPQRGSRGRSISRIETLNSERRPGIKLMSRYLSAMRTHSGPKNQVSIVDPFLDPSDLCLALRLI